MNLVSRWPLSQDGITGSDLLVESTTDTTTPTSYSFLDSDTEIIVVDTPGFDDTTCPDVDILTEFAQFLVALHNSEISLAGIVYLHRITDPRFSGTAMKTLEML